MSPQRKMIYSTMYLGHGAAGSQRMFTVPLGQQMSMMTGAGEHCQRCGHHGSVVQTREHTNMSRAGMLGEDLRLMSVRARAHDGSRPELAYEVMIDGKIVLGGPIWELLGESMALPRIEVKAQSTFEVMIAVPPGKSLERPEMVEEKIDHGYKFEPVIFGLGRQRFFETPFKIVTRPPLFLKVEFWTDVIGVPEESP